MDKVDWKPIKATPASLRITNPIRDIVDRLSSSNPNKEIISLSIGDPTVFGNFQNPDSVNDALIDNIKSRKFNGYPHSAGYPDTRKSIAKKYTTSASPLTFEDVIVCSGCSHAIELVVSVLAEEGSNILIPNPGFSLYQTMCDYKGVIAKGYKLLPEKSWEVDLKHLESLIDSKTAAILVNNPSNPCGSVYSKEHLLEIIQIAEKHHIPLIADEIYGGMIFEGQTFYPLGTLSKNVPILTVGGIAKQYLAPGWRVGWILIHDRHDLFKEVRVGLLKLTQIILGPNSLAQSVIDSALHHTSEEFYKKTNKQLEENAMYLCERLSNIKGLNPIRPGGTMYLMFGIDLNVFKDFKDDIDFARMLRAEESVAVLPGTIFKCPNFIRLVICPPMPKLKEACDRLEMFCKAHQKLVD